MLDVFITFFLNDVNNEVCHVYAYFWPLIILSELWNNCGH